MLNNKKQGGSNTTRPTLAARFEAAAPQLSTHTTTATCHANIHHGPIAPYDQSPKNNNDTTISVFLDDDDVNETSPKQLEPTIVPREPVITAKQRNSTTDTKQRDNSVGHVCFEIEMMPIRAITTLLLWQAHADDGHDPHTSMQHVYSEQHAIERKLKHAQQQLASDDADLQQLSQMVRASQFASIRYNRTSC